MKAAIGTSLCTANPGNIIANGAHLMYIQALAVAFQEQETGITLQEGGGGPQAWHAGLGGLKIAFPTPLQRHMWASGFTSHSFRHL